MNQGETVTMFNDMCVMAPATLIGPDIVWECDHRRIGGRVEDREPFSVSRQYGGADKAGPAARG